MSAPPNTVAPAANPLWGTHSNSPPERLTPHSVTVWPAEFTILFPDTWSPVMAPAARNMGISRAKGEFIGRPSLLRQKEHGVSRKLIGFELTQKAVPRHGMKIASAAKDVREIGVVTSGNLSPILQKGIGLGFVPPEFAAPENHILIDIRGRAHEALVVALPFYKRNP